jgi:ATP-dependent exoDNAse (exonuclease V) beta subunit
VTPGSPAAILADLGARERALDPARSFIVQAPAGSGKTTLLVERYLALLGVAAHPEEILAITFTRKAAAEMRKRVLARLAERGGAQAAAGVAHRLRIETIDAFCASLARRLPVLAQFGVPPGIVEDARELYREAAANVLGFLETKPFREEVARLLRHLDNNVATAAGLLADMLARRDQWLRRTGRAPTRAELESAFALERNRLIRKAKALDPRASVEFALEVLTKSGQWRKKPRPAPPDLAGNEPLRLALAALLELPPERYGDAQWAALEAMLALLPLAAAELKLVFAERGEADFTEVAQGAVRALGSPDEPTDLLLALDHRIRHVLVDEFQDTSISQWELLERLTAGWQPDDGRTLFLVGDPMQSIYRFREAVVALFLRARREGLANVRLEPVALTTNFRSQAKLVEWFNASFSQVLPPREDEACGAVPYSPAAPNAPALPGEAVTWHCCPDPVLESRKVVQLVKAAEGSCAILVRNRNALADIVPALKAAGVRFRAIEIDRLGEKQVVQDLFALTRALTHLADRVAWLAILRAPWVGLSLAEFSLHFENKAGTVWELVQDVPDLERFRAAIAPALENRLRGTLRDRVEGAWLALGGPACVAGATDLDDADAYLDALEQLEEAGEVDFARLAELLEELYAQPDHEAGENDLQIMTIHKAKGLEFGTVIVPGLDRVPRVGEPPLMRWTERAGEGLLLAPIKETGAIDEPAYEYLKRLDRDAEDTEAARLLYVAATRAAHRLHLLACPRKSMPPKRSLLACAWPVAQSIYEGLAPPEADTSTPAQPPAPFLLKRLVPDWSLPAPPPAVAWTPPPEGREEEQLPFDWARETVRHAGTVVHAWLHRIAEDELKGWDAKRVESLRPRFEADLKRRGVPAAYLDRALDIVITALTNTLADKRGRWLLGPHPFASNEYRLRARGRGLRIDRFIEASDGTKWVVDYKTSEHKGGGLDAFLDEQRERYQQQLDEYAAAIGGARRGLYFPLHKGWREW